MRKYYYFLLAVCLLSFCVLPVNASATDFSGGGAGSSFTATDEETKEIWNADSNDITDVSETILDDLGHVLGGWSKSKQSYAEKGYYFDQTEYTSVDNSYFYFSKDTLNGNYYYYVNVVSGKVSSHTYKQQWFKGDLNTVSERDDSYESGSPKMVLVINVTDGDYIYTNIPIFDKTDENYEENVQKYINNGDYSGSDNAEYLNKEIAKDDDSIEAPQGLKVSGGYATGLSSAYHFAHAFVSTWTQTVDTSEYVYDIQARCTISLVTKSGGAVLTGASYSSDWIEYGSKNYDGSTNITHSISKDNLNDKLLESALSNAMEKSGEKLTYKGYLITKLQVRVRNRVGNKCSDWFVATVDYNSSTTTGTVEDDEGNVIEDEGDIADYVNDNSGESMESNIANILDYIRSGFGLLGDNGIITLMSSCFLYLPASIWTMLKFLVAMTVVMALLGVAAKFVF